MMPGLDGFEVCRRLKADAATRDTLVIFLSALGEVSDKVSGLRLGAIDYIPKPIQAEEVLARIETHLTRQYLERELRASRDRLDRELAGAAGMQRLILPHTMPAHRAVEFASYYRTSRHAGGDYYDILDLGSDRFGLMIADVSGHGAPAAIVMSMIRAVLHSHPSPDDPAAVLQHLNGHFHYLWDTPMFATALYGVLDAARRTFRVSCAGHPPPLAARDGQVAPLAVDAVVPLLMMELSGVPCVEHQLQSNDRLLLYTDGVTERLAADGTMYDEGQLMESLASAARLEPGAAVDYLVAELEAFSGGHEPHDDQTLVLLGIGAEAPAPSR
jgi:sigma-B regulation protein RsbU (phosphoserine phosphatase)